MSKEEMPEVIFVSDSIFGMVQTSPRHGKYERNRYHRDDLYRALQAENEALRELVSRIVKGKDYYGEPCLQDFENDPLSWFHERDNLLESSDGTGE